MRWAALAIAVPVLTLVAYRLHGIDHPQPIPLPLAINAYAVTLLLAATILYGLAPRFFWAAPWASALAIAAAVEMIALPIVGTFLGTPWFSSSAVAYIALALLAYLLIEAHYRDRRAGAVIIPLFAIAAALHLRLGIAQLRPLSFDAVADGGVLVAQVIAVIGYMLLAAGATFAAWTLISRDSSHRVRAGGAAGLMLAANRSGLILFGIAALVWELSAHAAQRFALLLSPLEPWSAVVLLCYAGHMALIRLLSPSDRVTARWATILFGASIALLGASLALHDALRA